MTTNDTADGFDAALLIQAQELVHVGTWTWDVREDRIHWSDEMFRLLGMEPQSIILDLSTYLSFVHPDDREQVAGVIEGALANATSYELDHRLQTPGGRGVLHLNGRGNVLCDDAGNVVGMMGVCIDISHRVRQQEALRRSEERFRSIFEQSGIGIAVAEAGGRLTSINPAFAALLGYSIAELRAMTFLDVTHPDDLEITRRMMRHTRTVVGSYTYEKRYVRKDGAIVWARSTVSRLRNDDGTLDGYMGMIEDITQAKVAGEALQHQSELLQKIMDNLPVMVAMFGRDGVPVYVNREWQRILGWSLEEARAIDLIAAAYPNAAEAERVRADLRDGSGNCVDFEPLARDGRPVPSLWASTQLSDGTALCIGQDMTERTRLQQRLAQSAKMEALGQLAGGVAHDFNNLLTVISACATFLLDAVREDEASAADVSEILAASNRAAALTRQLLAFSRQQLLKPEPVDVNAATDRISRTLERLIGETIHLAVVPTATRATVQVDPHQLEQVLLNLVVNARDAIGDDGTITIETTNRRPAGEPDACEHVVISVSDDGCGIEPALLSRIFDPFFTTKPVGKGTGLGLATVHGIVEQSGGRIEVTSEVGRGTTFHVLLPAVSAARNAIAPSGHAEPLRGSETILLVEDEASLRAVVRRVLSGLGYTVLEARHGADGARVSAHHDGPIDLLITDVVMPAVGGRELAQLVRAQRPGIPVLYITGYTDDELLRKGILEPGAQLLREPFLPAELAQMARQLLSRSA